MFRELNIFWIFRELDIFCFFFNNLFDSLNGGATKTKINPLRSAITKKNKDKIFEFWEYAISMLETMDFVDKTTKKVNNGSSVLKKTISTIRGFMKLTTLCLSLGKIGKMILFVLAYQAFRFLELSNRLCAFLQKKKFGIQS